MLQIKLLRNESRAPSRAHASDAGLDIYHVGKTLTIKAGAKCKIGTGFAMCIPQGYMAQITPRSGLGSKNEIVLSNLVGTVDSDYRGEVFATLKNNGKEDYTINTGDRVMQMTIIACELWQPQIVRDLPDTIRGAKGLGGTGK